ncbi:MAG: STAS domain-containing protein [Planctomycetaceae bacterium]|nr:STAS domain-containing protein [Planctomycetaceae bacterium]
MIEHTRHGAVDVISIQDSLTHTNADQAQKEILSHISPGQPRVVVELSEMTFCDSSGLETILDLRDHCVKRGGLFKLAAANNLCTDILQVTGLLDSMELYNDPVSAAGSFAT